MQTRTAVASEAYRSIAAWPAPPTITADCPVPTPPDQADAAAKVTQAMHAVLPNAQVGFAVFDRRNDMVLTSHNAGQRFASMSVVKLLIALDALTGDNRENPDVATQQDLHQMLADSDDGIASNLWAAGGGPAIVTRMVGLLGLTGTQPPENPSRWGDTLITPQDIVTVYRYITDRLPSSDRDLVLAALSNAPQRAEDGFDQYFGIPEGMPRTTWAVKQGWGTSGSQAVMNSTGLVGTGLRYVVVVLASASAKSYSTVPAVVTAGAGALADLVCPASS
ncbi:MAG: hypothetical protein ACRDTA_09195 [Pseudonocardiaceae bacterium]